MKISEMIEMTKEVKDMFDKISTKKWGIETIMTELTGEVGTLADSIMIKEGYRATREGQVIDLADDIMDVIFMLILISDYYNIDMEEAYKNMIKITKEKLNKKMSLSQA